MQMKRKDSGITIIALVITIIVLLIITGIVMSAGIENIPEVENAVYESELVMVQKAATEKYMYAKTVGETERKITNISNPDGNKPNSFKGTIVANTSGINTSKAGEYILENSYTLSVSMTYDDCYYRLKPSDLEAIGISKGSDTYIVNYKTGEVYNETTQTILQTVSNFDALTSTVTETVESKTLYLPSIIAKEREEENLDFTNDIFDGDTL